MDVQKIRQDFPTLASDNAPAYLDNACVTLRPNSVIKSILDYYELSPGCGGRSVHKYATMVSKAIVESRKKLSTMVNANEMNEIVFTKNATQSLNQISKGLSWEKGDIVLTTDREHNSNLVPWLQLEQEQGVDHRVIPSFKDNTFNLEEFEKMCNEAGDKLRMVSVGHVGNLDGVSTPVKEIAKIAHDFDALVCVDGAQSLPHKPVDVQDLGVDFFAFSIHKMCGPSGMGGFWAKKELLESLRSIQAGGQTVKSTRYDGFEWAEPPARFEGGLGHFAGMKATGDAVDYLSSFDLNEVYEHEVRLNSIMTNRLKDIDGVEIIGPEQPSLRGGILSLHLKKHDPHEIAMLLDESNDVMVRSGQHCVHSWFHAHNIEGSLRASAYLYNTEEDVKRFSETLEEILTILG
ncbi:MAG: aminotransferase class V-fold PLP-dependent enzyme [archaeon]|nr:aminotransferase class V-fold PLP-dependent enzyme [archaeon]